MADVTATDAGRREPPSKTEERWYPGVGPERSREPKRRTREL